MAKNYLFYGDNLEVLRGRNLKGDRHIKDESVDLIYLDPPFNSNQAFNVIFRQNGKASPAQVMGFDDTWTWGPAAAKEYEDIKNAGGKVAECLIGLEKIIGYSNMFAYLVMMAPRLIEMRRVLKPTGSIYLHCDPTASHYIKILLDSVFGVDRFKNEIIWHYPDKLQGNIKGLPQNHDIIFFYSISKEIIWNPVMIKLDAPRKINARYWDGEMMATKHDANGKVIYNTYTEKRADDVWVIPKSCVTKGKEGLGYPTQKPEALLERIIKASSNKGDVILDPFCGCGTAVVVANRLERNWIGIDMTHLAINLIKHRLAPQEAQYEVIGEPKDYDGALQLATEDEYQFQLWALGLDKARPNDGIKKGKDRGIDGKRFFTIHDKTQMIIYSVKSGHVGSKDVRELKGTLEDNSAAIGVLISLEPITKEMKMEAAKGGFYIPNGLAENKFPKIQVYTVEELMSGKKSVQWPQYLKDVTLPEVAKKEPEAPVVRSRPLADFTEEE